MIFLIMVVFFCMELALFGSQNNYLGNALQSNVHQGNNSFQASNYLTALTEARSHGSQLDLAQRLSNLENKIRQIETKHQELIQFHTKEIVPFILPIIISTMQSLITQQVQESFQKVESEGKFVSKAVFSEDIVNLNGSILNLNALLKRKVELLNLTIQETNGVWLNNFHEFRNELQKSQNAVTGVQVEVQKIQGQITTFLSIFKRLEDTDCLLQELNLRLLRHEEHIANVADENYDSLKVRDFSNENNVDVDQYYLDHFCSIPTNKSSTQPPTPQELGILARGFVGNTVDVARSTFSLHSRPILSNDSLDE